MKKRSLMKSKVLMMPARFISWIAIVLMSVMPIVTAAAAGPGLDPASVTATIAPGGNLVITKTVHTPTIPPLPDIVFLADTTGSMGSTLANVQANIGPIMAGVGDPTAEFGAANYKDFNCAASAYPYNLDQALTANTANVVTAVGTWATVIGDGCDTPEAQLNALFQLSTDPSVGFRSGSTRVIVWFGDASGHDPSNGHSLADVITALNSASIRVIAVPVDSGGGDGLDATGQATAITGATGGVLLPGATPDQVSNAIVAGLSSLPAIVTMESDCTAPISTSFSPASQTVTSGTDAVFTETISVAANAAQGVTYTCNDWATINGTRMTDASGNVILEVKTITVPDVTAPVVTCLETINPHGKTVPPAGATLPGPKGGQNPDGYYLLTATDNVDPNASIYVVDTGSGTVFGPFPSGTQIKYVEAPDATPSQKKIGSTTGSAGAIAWLITGTGDAAVYAVDASGNKSDLADCLVPPPPL